MEIAVLVFDRMTVLDAVGAYEVLSRLPEARLRLVGEKPGPVVSDTGMLTLLAEAGIDDVAAADILLVPGGPPDAIEAVLANRRIVDWVARIHERSRYTVSVCTGSWILGAAGALRGKRAGCHWLALDRLKEFGAEPSKQRVVVDGKLWTAGGVTSGIDMALAFAAAVVNPDFAQALQLGMQYDPEPPFRAGTPERAPAHVVALTRAAMGGPTDG